MPQFVPHFADSKGFFYPGEIIEGRIIVRLGKAIKIRKMTLRFEGKSKIRYAINSGNHTEVHSNKEIFFDARRVLLEPSPPHEASVLLQPGEFSYPFQFQLPPNLPPSVVVHIGEHKGFVQYVMTIEIFTKNRMKSADESGKFFLEVRVCNIEL